MVGIEIHCPINASRHLLRDPIGHQELGREKGEKVCNSLCCYETVCLCNLDDKLGKGKRISNLLEIRQ